MKRIYIQIAAFLSCLALWSCESMFENEVPPHDLVGENAIINETSAEVALNGIYSYLGGYGSMSSLYIIYDEFRAGLLEGGNSDKDDQLLLGNIESEEDMCINPWQTAYQLINAANNFIYNVEKLSESAFGEGRKTEMLAEARFMRAFAHTMMLKRYGYFFDINHELGALMRMEPSSLSNNNKGRSTVAESYRLIFEDYDYAIKYGATFTDCYHACATTAKAFKADLLMNRGQEGDYTEAIRLADEVLKSPEFELDSTFAGIFEKGYESKELLFSRALTTLPTPGENNSSIYNYLGQGTYRASEKFLEYFPEEDARFKTTLDSMEVDRGSGRIEKRFVWAKHFVADGNCPMWYMRLSQMHLIKAEAMLYTGAPTADILEELNVLRRRSKNTKLKEEDYQDMESLQRLIFTENLREIGMENGALFYLAVRTKINNIRLLQELNSNYDNDNKLVFPIPDGELDHNLDIEQKPL